MRSLSTKEFDQTAIKMQLEALKSNYKTLSLATKTSSGEVECSYAPYMCYEGRYYVILSKIVTHYDNVASGHVFQAMMLEDEKEVSNVFFRQRIIYNFKCDDKVEDKVIIDAFVDTHGIIVEKLLTMDFDIFALKLIDGRVILGPGKAFKFDNVEAITEQITAK